MDLFEVVIVPKALQQLDKYIEYIRYTLLNEEAAGNVWLDALDTVSELESVAGSLHLCEHPVLHELGYRAKLFQRHDYVMLYRIEGRTAYVEGIYHLLQDYANIFMRDRVTQN